MTANQKIRQARLMEWANIFTEHKSSGLTIRQWCKENNVSLNQFHYWKRALKEELTNQALPDIAPISLPLPASLQANHPIHVDNITCTSCTSNHPITFRVNGISFEVESNISESFLCTLIKAARYA